MLCENCNSSNITVHKLLYGNIGAPSAYVLSGCSEYWQQDVGDLQSLKSRLSHPCQKNGETLMFLDILK